ncbi:MAG: LysE family translocator [Nitriliruptoraceae bacterium]|nr:LysE family translocator [Nitriliruptoraceae bacterium]
MVILILLTPGPDMAFMVASGVEGGHPGALRAALGITAAVSVYVLLTALGLGAALVAAPMLLDWVRALGAAYLAWLGVGTWRESMRVRQRDELPSSASGRYFTRGFVVNITNPQILLFFAALLPQFVTTGHGPFALQILTLGLLVQLTGFLLDVGFGFAAGTFRDRILKNEQAQIRLLRTAAIAYLCLSIAITADLASP